MGDANDPNAWAGLLRWSLSYQDGTIPSDLNTMSDEDRQWLEKVMGEGVRDDVKAMTEIYYRLCAYLDLVATASASASTSTPTSLSSVAPSSSAATGTGAEDEGASGGGVVAGQGAAAGATAGALSGTVVVAGARSGTLSTFVSHRRTAPAEAGGGGDNASSAEGPSAQDEEKVDKIMNDLEELQDIVEQIDMAETFVKIGGFGRLIALSAPAYRPERLRLRAASVIATLTKNNPVAQVEFSSSGGQRAFMEAATSSGEEGGGVPPSPALRLACLHALSCSVMGNSASEDALCAEQRFQDLLQNALGQGGELEGEEGGSGGGDAGVIPTRAKLRSKAAFVLKALVGAPGASASRTASLWPAILGLVGGLEAVASSDPGDDPAAERETCIEALLAASRSTGGGRLLGELGGRIAVVMARRRQVLVSGGQHSQGAPRSPEDEESAAVELGLWMQWERLSGPPQ